jgi:hypothetical protein
MDSQDIIRISHKAKTETEAFINRHLNDQAKGWPKLCPAPGRYRAVPLPFIRQLGRPAAAK